MIMRVEERGLSCYEEEICSAWASYIEAEVQMSRRTWEREVMDGCMFGDEGRKCSVGRG